MSSRVVSKDLVQSWIELGLRSIGGLENYEDMESFDFQTLTFKIKPKELPVETILHTKNKTEEEYLANGKRKKLSKGI